MIGISRWLVDEAATLGLEGVHEPVLAFAQGGRLDLGALLPELPPVFSSPLSHRVRTTMRTYLHPRRPEAPSLIVDGATLGVELPFDEGAWCVVECGAITIYAPHGLPRTAGVAAVGRRLGDVVSIAGVEPFDYPVAQARVAVGHPPGSPRFDVICAPVPILQIVAAPVVSAT